MRKFVFVVGPTASGKSQLAIDLALKTNGVIFNCDSVQLYKKVDIGAAKPTREERQIVPHYLFDIMGPPDVMTSGEYRRIFLETLETVSEDKTIYVVGGTGFYFLALEKGLFEIDEPTEEEKKKIEEELSQPGGIERLLREVEMRDPEHAKKLHLNDTYRIGRAVEILRANPTRTIVDMLEQKKQSKGLDGEIRKIGLKWEPRDLESRIRLRTQKMLQEGLIEEARGLVEDGLEDWAPLRSVGYKETLKFLKGEISRADLEEQIVIATRQLSKKQRTWFQRDKEIHWIAGGSEDIMTQGFKIVNDYKLAP